MRKGAYTAQEREDAWAEAEQKLTTEGRAGTEPVFVTSDPAKIKTMPELFQPREFTYGFHDTDKAHVKALTRTLDDNIELDPVLVIKLKGTGWVCVDGHHRIAAYLAAGKHEIQCEWFGGSVRAAIDQSIALNKKEHLSVPREDRLEEAWKRVILDWGSLRSIADLCGVSQRTVSTMRSYLHAAYSKDASDIAAKEFQKRLRKEGRKIKDMSWSHVKLVWLGVDGKEISGETRAVRLAKRIRSRMTDLLSRDPAVTARALQLYDPDLAETLIEELQNVVACKPFETAEAA